MSDSTPSPHYRFGVFELDVVAGELRRQGRRVALAPQPAAVLARLVERAGEVVTREEIRELLWGGEEPTHVDFDPAINTAVRSVRTALGDRAGSARFVETLPRRGYRFLADVERLGTPGTATSASSHSSPAVGGEGGRTGEAEAATPPPRLRVRAPLAVPARVWVAVLALVGIAALVVWSRPDTPVAPNSGISNSGISNSGIPASPADGRVMLAVLPFEDLGPASGEGWFSAGLTEELIAQLGRVDPARLGVIARTSVVGLDLAEEDAASLGRRLGVEYLLEGSVRRDRATNPTNPTDPTDPTDSVASERVRITAQLIRVADQTHLWTESFDRPVDDVLRVQEEVARRVRRSLLGELLPDREESLAPGSRQGHMPYGVHASVPATAYRHYLRARYHFTRYDREGYHAAIASYRRALEEAPEYAAAWAGLAEAHAFLSWAGVAPEEAFPEARRAAERAVALDPASARGHTALGIVRVYYLHDFSGAEASFRRTLELDPGFAEAHHWAAGLYSALGRHDEAIAHDLAARRLDPVSLTVRSDLCWYYAFARRWDDAVAECGEALTLDPDHRWSLAGLALSHRRRGELDAAWRARRRLLELADLLPPELATEGDARVALDRADDLELERLLAAAAEGHEGAAGTAEPSDPIHVAMALGRAGHLDAAFEALDRAVDERRAWVVFLDADPRFDALRGDPRFADLRRRVGLEVAGRDDDHGL